MTVAAMVENVLSCATAEIGFDGVVGANFFISGSVVLTAASLIAMIAGGSKNFSKWAIAVLALVICCVARMSLCSCAGRSAFGLHLSSRSFLLASSSAICSLVRVCPVRSLVVPELSSRQSLA